MGRRMEDVKESLFVGCGTIVGWWFILGIGATALVYVVIPVVAVIVSPVVFGALWLFTTIKELFT